MNNFTGCCFSILLVTNCFAEPATSPLPAHLIKVTNENNPKCVEYVLYKGEIYCSLVTMGKTPVDPKILGYEKQNIIFDDRAWKAGWGKNTKEISTVEYIPVQDNIDHWNELITTQFIPHTTTTPSHYADKFIDNLNKSGITSTFSVIENKGNQLIFEFKVDKPVNLQQDEIQKVVTEKNGMYILHYVMKQHDMGEKNRQKWIGNMKKSSVKE
jgi:hypothetical protein